MNVNVSSTEMFKNTAGRAHGENFLAIFEILPKKPEDCIPLYDAAFWPS